MTLRLRAPFGLPFCIALVALAGCNPQSQGFALPPGDAQAGAVTFVQLQCNQCHQIEGVIEKREDSLYPGVTVVLGGQAGRIKTYGELVTSIIHPSQKLSRPTEPATQLSDDASIMPLYNSQMTVTQLINLTSFLQGTYVLRVPEYRSIEGS